MVKKITSNGKTLKLSQLSSEIPELNYIHRLIHRFLLSPLKFNVLEGLTNAIRTRRKNIGKTLHAHIPRKAKSIWGKKKKNPSGPYEN